jgi:hypothetical protein
MAKSELRRIPFVLNLEDPVDAAIWQALEPLLARRRASQFIRGAVAHALGVGSLLTPVALSAPPPGPTQRALPAGDVPQTKRLTRKAMIQDDPIDEGSDDGALDEATGNFLDMFG